MSNLLSKLEAESIHIIREAYAQSENPVLLYSIGKDSAVLLHLAKRLSSSSTSSSRGFAGNSKICTISGMHWALSDIRMITILTLKESREY